MHGNEDVEDMEIDWPDCAGDGYLDNGRVCPGCGGRGAIPAYLEDE